VPDNNLKVLKITDKASKKGLQEMLAHEAAKRGWGIHRLTAKIIEEALKNQDNYNGKKLANPLLNEDGNEIICKLPLTIKKQFKDWAKSAERNQSQHACFIFEKWCEDNGLVPPVS
jgi:hypothetical protein